jgi:hypothetical protein
LGETTQRLRDAGEAALAATHGVEDVDSPTGEGGSGCPD